jgi:hypothetical protein
MSCSLPADNNVKHFGIWMQAIRVQLDPKKERMALPLFLTELKALTLAEITHIQGFMQLVMKPRNGMPWSAEDRAAILAHLKHLGKSLPLLAIFTLPGGGLLLPLLPWFLERRKKGSKLPITSASAAGPANPSTEATQQPVQ